MMGIKFRATEIRSKSPKAYMKLANWYTRDDDMQSADYDVEEAMFMTAFPYIDLELILQFLVSEGISIQTCGGPSLGYNYYFQGDKIPIDFLYYSEPSALYAGAYVALIQMG